MRLNLSDFPGLLQNKIPAKLPSVDGLLKRQRSIVSKAGPPGAFRRDLKYKDVKNATKRILQQNDITMLVGLQELAEQGAIFELDGDTLIAKVGTFVGKCYLDPNRPEFVKRAKEINTTEINNKN